MRRLHKCLLFCVLLIGFGLSAVTLSSFYPIPFIQENLVIYGLDYILAGYSAVICLCFIVLMIITIFFPSKSNFLVIPKEKGRIIFSKRTIESTVRYSFAKMDGINSSKIQIRIGKKPEKTRVFIKLSTNDTEHLSTLTEGIQDKITESMLSSLGITVKSVTVEVSEFKPPSTQFETE